MAGKRRTGNPVRRQECEGALLHARRCTSRTQLMRRRLRHG